MARKPRRDEITRPQRALWTFLLATLVAPAIAACVLFIASLAAGTFGFAPPNLQGLSGGALLSVAGERALTTYIWSAIPCALAGAGLAAVVMINGTFGWLSAAVTGVLAFAAVAIIGGGQITNHLTPLAALSGAVAIALRAVLVRGGILDSAGQKE